MHNNDIWLAGYDDKGKIYVKGDHIEREIRPEYASDVMDIFGLYKKYNLENIGIVKTDIGIGVNVLRHEKHLISYPFEWTANMYKNAVLFHLNLFLKLDKHELTLKDALPNNIVFDYCKPIFVDFLSLIKKSSLGGESWLMKGKYNTEPRFTVFDVMFIPFMLVPFMAMAEKKYYLARRMLSDQACNCGGDSPHWKDVYSGSLLEYGLWSKAIILHLIKKILMKHSDLPVFPRQTTRISRLLSLTKKTNFINYCSQLIQFVDSVDVTPPKSGYLSYYDDKGEKFDLSDQACWQNKQKAIAKIIDSEKPGTMLDIGANTGWFSILAAWRGIKVISTDVDESSIDTLYTYSKKHQLQILTLLISFNDMTRKIFGIDCGDSKYSDRNFNATPLYLPATERLKSDMVLCLGLLHHLVLGDGISISNIFIVLSELTRKTLIIEYIDLEDNLIANDMSFFNKINNYTNETYNIDIIIEQGKKHFMNVETVSSHPDTRKILVFNK